MKPEKRKYDNGKYMMVYDSNNPRAYKDGYVYEHVAIVEKLNRKLREGEHVHHLDLNPYNNEYSNLCILEKGQHTKIHNFIKRNPEIESAFKEYTSDDYSVWECECCGSYLNTNRKFCNRECQRKYTEWKRPSLEEIQELLNQNYNKVQIGKKFNVHRSTINSWLREYGVDLSVK